jgi:hypothetical protein
MIVFGMMILFGLALIVLWLSPALSNLKTKVLNLLIVDFT